MANYFIRKLALRAHLGDEDIAALKAATADTIHVGRGHELVKEGDNPDHTYVILRGFACRYKTTANGARSIIAYLVPGDGCSLHGSILDRTVHTTAALTPCTVALVPYRQIKELAAYRPNIYLALWWNVLVDEAITEEWLVGIGQRSANRQVAHFICETFARLRAVGLALEPGFCLPVTQAEMADSAGLSHVHLHRVITELRKQHLIEDRRAGIAVPHYGRLTDYAEFDPCYLHLDTSAGGGKTPLGLSAATRAAYERQFR